MESERRAPGRGFPVSGTCRPWVVRPCRAQAPGRQTQERKGWPVRLRGGRVAAESGAGRTRWRRDWKGSSSQCEARGWGSLAGGEFVSVWNCPRGLHVLVSAHSATHRGPRRCTLLTLRSPDNPRPPPLSSLTGPEAEAPSGTRRLRASPAPPRTPARVSGGSPAPRARRGLRKGRRVQPRRGQAFPLALRGERRAGTLCRRCPGTNGPSKGEADGGSLGP